MALATFKLPRNIPAVIEKCKDIIARLIANVAVYATPNPTPVSLTGFVTKLENSYQVASKGGTDKKAQMKLDKQALLNNMTGLLDYIQTTSAGDQSKILLVADVKKRPSPKDLLPPPVNLRSDYGIHSGEIDFHWNGVIGRTLYTLQMNDAPGDDSKWKDVGFTGKTRFTLSGLISGKDYGLRIATISTAGISGWSDPSFHKAS